MLTSTAPVYRVHSLDEALSARAEHPEATLLAGGTDLMVFLELGSVNPAAFIDLWGVRELAGIEVTTEGLWLGALCTYTDLIESEIVRRDAPILVEAARTCGAKQIQNRGTLGGNIANASPAGDSLPVLLALDAEVELRSEARGARTVPIDRLYSGYRTLRMELDEIITRVFLPKPHPGDHCYYRKVGTRAAQSISKVVLGARVRIEGGLVTEARFAFGSVAATPVRAKRTEAAAVGQSVDPEVVSALKGDITPIDDIRSTGAYRAQVAANILKGWLESL